MSVSNLFERIMGLQLQRRERRQNSYLEMVAAVAKDEEPNPDEVEAILDTVHKTVDDLRLDVERYRKRMQLKATVEALPKVERELEQLTSQIQAADKLLEDAEARHQHQTAPLYARQAELVEARKEASMANKQLFETCDDTVLHAMLGQVSSELEQSLEKSRDLVAQVSFYRTKADNERQRANREIKQEDRDHRLEQAEVYEKHAKVLEQQLKAAEKERELLVKRREDVEARMREW
jgi:DNA repair exonuclease SbcCD ATPase subunit